MIMVDYRFWKFCCLPPITGWYYWLVLAGVIGWYYWLVLAGITGWYYLLLLAGIIGWYYWSVLAGITGWYWLVLIHYRTWAFGFVASSGSRKPYGRGFPFSQPPGCGGRPAWCKVPRQAGCGGSSFMYVKHNEYGSLSVLEIAVYLKSDSKS